MLRALPAACAILTGAAAAAPAPDDPGALFEMPLPGGLRAALAVVDDRAAPDRSQFLLEFIRRSYHTPFAVRNERRTLVLDALLTHLDRSGSAAAAAPVRDTLPLPLSPQLWTEVVFGGRAPRGPLVSDILRSRSASLFYYALLSLDNGTRAWLSTRRDLIGELSARNTGALLVAAPGLRIAAGAVEVPGGADAEAVWEAIVGRPAGDAAEFLRALVSQGEGRLAYFYGAVAQLTAPQRRAALNLDASDMAARIAAARRLFAAFERLAADWRIEDRVFSRPSLDPALLIADMRADRQGRPVMPLTAEFWTAMFAAGPSKTTPETVPALVAGEAVEFGWLADQVFRRDEFDERRYEQVLFASRALSNITIANAADAFEAIRAVGEYRALVPALERAQVRDVGVIAAVARRAARLSAIDDDSRLVRGLAQFQGLVALVTRAAIRGSLTPAAAGDALRSLASVDPTERGDYDGRLVRWFDTQLLGQLRAAPAPTLSSTIPSPATATLESAALLLLAGPAAHPPRVVDWEGTRYRLDFTRAEALRLERLVGDDRRPYLSAARAFVTAADAIAGAGLTGDALRQHAEELSIAAGAVSQGTPGRWSGLVARERFSKAAADLARSDVRSAGRLSPALRVLADDLLARGLMELAYAVALGQPDRMFISAGDAASRHEFGPREPSFGRRAVWRAPATRADRVRQWRVAGSLLGLDVLLAEYSLLPLTLKPPPTRPTLNEDDRRTMIEAAVLVQPAALDDSVRDVIVGAIRKGRAMLAAAQTPADAAALARAAGLRGPRRALLTWVIERDRARAPVFLSLTELLRVGLADAPRPEGLDAWGAPARPRLGCFCLELRPDRPDEILAGRWYSGILASGFADLHLRLAELLAELKMPAAMLAPVVASAALDFVSNVTSRDLDDRRGLVEFVHALPIDRAEEYLALQTTGGPLAPLAESSESGPAAAAQGGEHR